MDKEAELLKIQIYADYFHTQYSTFSAIGFAILITGAFFGLTEIVITYLLLRSSWSLLE